MQKPCLLLHPAALSATKGGFSNMLNYIINLLIFTTKNRIAFMAARLV